ncbi:mitoferrin-1-related [Anaeramoeba flamelloides]|uniref:Mitoferrin-1-related n=1 Tax=Anaeramoeba flamelloides TaxID=1746091 RepID=A0AAV7Z3V3_9EUKA|nr:mitoferrin-1-related [Anaeramoeba flamelloides]
MTGNTKEENVTNKTKLKPFRHFLAGCFARVGTAVLFSPGDTIKTRIQFSGYNTKNLFKSSVLGSLTSAPTTGLSFLVYHYVKTLRKSSTKLKISPDTNVVSRIIKQITDDPKPAILGGLSRALVISFKNPMEIAKQYYQLRDVSGLEIKSMSQAFQSGYKLHGLFSFFDGFAPYLIRDLLSYPLYWGIYDLVKEKQNEFKNKYNKDTKSGHGDNTDRPSKWYKLISNQQKKNGKNEKITGTEKRQNSDQKLSLLNYLVSSTCATITSTTFTIPFDVLKTKMQTRRFVENGEEKYGTLMSAIKTIYLEEGLMGFVKGLGTKLAVIVPASAATFTIYETIIYYFEKRDGEKGLFSSVLENNIFNNNYDQAKEEIKNNIFWLDYYY